MVVSLNFVPLRFSSTAGSFDSQAGCKTGSQIPFLRPCRNACGRSLDLRVELKLEEDLSQSELIMCCFCWRFVLGDFYVRIIYITSIRKTRKGRFMAKYQLKMCIEFVASGGFLPDLPRLKVPSKRDEWIRVLNEICKSAWIP